MSGSARWRLLGFTIALASVISASAIPHSQAQPARVAYPSTLVPVQRSLLGPSPVDPVQEVHQLKVALAEAQRRARIHHLRVLAARRRARARARAARIAQERLAAAAQVSTQPDPGGQAPAQEAPAPATSGGGWQDIVRSLTDAASASCAIEIFTRESGGNVYATNPTSGAYGIPQALPGSKMASAGADWQTNPVTQIRWGLGYMVSSYGSACGAWGFWQAHSWY